MKPIVITHCGQLGDFIYAWPVASKLYQMTGRKIHWVLPRCFGPFAAVQSLLQIQPMTQHVTLCDHKVLNYGHGGQPYKFDVAQYGIAVDPGDPHGCYNLGFRGAPDKFVTEYIADEYNLGWDENFEIYLGPPKDEDYQKAYDWHWIHDRFRAAAHMRGAQFEQYKDLPFGRFREMLLTHPYNDDFFAIVPPVEQRLRDLQTEHANFPPRRRINVFHSVLFNARWMRECHNRHCFHSSMAVILYFARVPFLLYRQPGHPRHNYFPDTSRFKAMELPA